jgi:rhamnulokinase
MPSMPAGPAVVAVDLGASSGRVVVGEIGPDRLLTREAHRFPNGPTVREGRLYWDLDRILREVQHGLRIAGRTADVTGVAVDSWGVDYGLVGPSGQLTAPPRHYRDPRGATGLRLVHERIDPGRLYRMNGLQQLPISTVYQLATEPESALRQARWLMLIADLVGFRLTGTAVTELTNASTTGLLEAHSQRWAAEILRVVGVQQEQLADLVAPGTVVGPLRADVLARTGLRSTTELSTVGSHDTASAVAAVPAAGPDFAYVSCGTWALVGVELDAPLISDRGLRGGFTNEIGVDGTVRYLHNVMGLWILQQTMADWRARGVPADLPALLAAAADSPSGGPVFDVDHPELQSLGDMPARIARACRRAGFDPPEGRPAMVRCILDSMASAMARAVREACALTGRRVSVVHLVGGGARNGLLCQLVADAVGLPVVAGPVEATAIGNLLVQARTHGLNAGDRYTLRDLVRRTQQLTRYEPR